MKSKDKKRKKAKNARKAKRAVNREYAIISYFFVLIFLALAGYMVYFNGALREDVINSPYNTRQNKFKERILRGAIVSQDEQVLARTEVDANGNETRVYPFANVYAHVVGYDAKGGSGMESLANFSLMTSHNDYVDQVKNEILENKNPGDTVVATLNNSLQQTAYNALGGYQGAVVVMDPKTGAVLANVSKPDFNPNTIEQDWEMLVNNTNSGALLNRATQGAYPPGSIFKVVDALAYLRKHGTIDGYQYTCNGSISVDGHTIPCFGGEVHGTEDFTTAFSKSCNTAFTQMGLDLGKDTLTSTAESLLFNSKLPIGLDYSKSKFDLGEYPGNALLMQTAIGQGNTLVSPMHMAMITSAIANEGKLMEPYYVDRVETVKGKVVEKTKPKVYKELMSKTEADTLKGLMTEVVNSGTGRSLAGEAYSAAGKTGSAEYYGPDGSVKTHSWFIGFSNVEDPDLVVAIIAEGAGTGSKVAIPVAHQIFNAYYYSGM